MSEINPIRTSHIPLPSLQEGVKVSVIDTLEVSSHPLPDAPPKKPVLDPPENSSDALIDRSVLLAAKELRELYYQNATLFFQDIRARSQDKKALHEAFDMLEKALEGRAKEHEILGWIQGGTAAALITLSIVCFAMSVATGGVSAVLGGITAAAAAAQGVTSAGNGVLQLDTTKKQGEALVLRTLREEDERKIHELLSRCGLNNDEIQKLWRLSMEIVRQQSRFKPL